MIVTALGVTDHVLGHGVFRPAPCLIAMPVACARTPVAHVHVHVVVRACVRVCLRVCSPRPTRNHAIAGLRTAQRSDRIAVRMHARTLARSLARSLARTDACAQARTCKHVSAHRACMCTPDPCVHAGVCTDMCTNRCVDGCTDMCTGLCTGLCTDMCTDLCADMCTDMCTYMCIDICIGRRSSPSTLVGTASLAGTHPMFIPSHQHGAVICHTRPCHATPRTMPHTPCHAIPCHTPSCHATAGCYNCHCGRCFLR